MLRGGGIYPAGGWTLPLWKPMFLGPCKRIPARARLAALKAGAPRQGSGPQLCSEFLTVSRPWSSTCRRGKNGRRLETQAMMSFSSVGGAELCPQVSSGSWSPCSLSGCSSSPVCCDFDRDSCPLWSSVSFLLIQSDLERSLELEWLPRAQGGSGSLQAARRRQARNHHF